MFFFPESLPRVHAHVFQVKLINAGTFGCTYALLWHGQPIAAVKTAKKTEVPLEQQEIDALIKVSHITRLLRS